VGGDDGDATPDGKDETMAITERALLQRVNRRLLAMDQTVRRSRPVRAYVDAGYPNPYPHDLGKFFRINTRNGFLIETHVDLEGLARDVEALAPGEALAMEAD
jgi:hypothetical protein